MVADEIDTTGTRRRRDRLPSPPRRLFVLFVAGVVPWTVVLGDGATFVHAFGIVTLDPPSVTNLYTYLFVLTDGLPRRLQVWPASVLLYLSAVASGIGGVLGREDVRLTAGLLVMAGIAQAQLAFGLLRVGVTALPIGSILLWAIVWWMYWETVQERGLFGSSG